MSSWYISIYKNKYEKYRALVLNGKRGSKTRNQVILLFVIIIMITIIIVVWHLTIIYTWYIIIYNIEDIRNLSDNDKCNWFLLARIYWSSSFSLILSNSCFFIIVIIIIFALVFYHFLSFKRFDILLLYAWMPPSVYEHTPFATLYFI